MTDNFKKCVRVERKTTVTVNREHIDKMLRDAVGAPDRATVDIDDYADEAKISWTEYGEEGETK